jgi:hypothetical protein
MYNAALLSHPQHSLYSTMGDASGLLVGVALPEGDKILKIKSLTEKFEMIPQVNRLGNQVSIFTGNQIPAAGNYTLNSEDTILSSLAFNYNRGESDPACNSKSELQSIIDKSRATNISIVNNPEKPMNEFIETLYSGTQLWKYFIWLALLALAAEVLLIRFYKKPTR